MNTFYIMYLFNVSDSVEALYHDAILTGKAGLFF